MDGQKEHATADRSRIKIVRRMPKRWSQRRVPTERVDKKAKR